MKKIVALLVALMLVCSAAAMAATDIAILVPNADHGWTGAVLTYAEEKAAAINAEGKYEAKVISSADPANQISQIEDIIENESAKSIVILPQDNTLEATMKKLADSGIPFVMFDRVIDSVFEASVAAVKGDNNGIGAETAKRFIAAGMKPGDAIFFPGHVAMYLGDNRYCHSTAKSSGFDINSLDPSDSDYREDLHRKITGVASYF